MFYYTRGGDTPSNRVLGHLVASFKLSYTPQVWPLTNVTGSVPTPNVSANQPGPLINGRPEACMWVVTTLISWLPCASKVRASRFSTTIRSNLFFQSNGGGYRIRCCRLRRDITLLGWWIVFSCHGFTSSLKHWVLAYGGFIHGSSVGVHKHNSRQLGNVVEAALLLQ